ncbi:MAG: hypothetical protein S4CHLAM45_14170 [Chlamydiales bacterium]|nr:hypothetical protein [Chlamydiales bacterium]MCH9620074.1 hypothetical protein [Chlamydiales bacterium]MCH9623507.1 hypothetical protein [Chlamydiales bacterium]
MLESVQSTGRAIVGAFDYNYAEMPTQMKTIYAGAHLTAFAGSTYLLATTPEKAYVAIAALPASLLGIAQIAKHYLCR